ncbi:tyrosine-type recombinase/integrase [Corynebacterium sp. A21]|uniref:tyrosine-type recombinase/integrase n=1 Tax=Corynebacterium sp. A21 TaxID=3457318 RepID=UPI003FD5C246
MARKRRKFGSIRELPSGKSQAHFTHPDGERIKAPSTFPTYGDAEGWLKTQEREIELGIWVHPELKANQAERNALTVGQWLDQHHDIKETEIELGSVQRYRMITATRITEIDCEIKNVPLVDLTKAHVFRWWDHITLNFSTPPTNHAAYKRLRAACTAAVERGMIDANPVYIKAASKQPVAKNKELADKEELQAIVDNIYLRYKFAAVLALFHGLRVGEALAVSESDLKFSAAPKPGPWLPIVEVRVRENAQIIKQKNGRWQLTIKDAPKTKAGFRDVPIFAEFVPLLFWHLKTYPLSETGKLTTARTGNICSPSSLRKAMEFAKSKAGVNPEITPHYGRNWLITELAEKGATAQEIGRILGQDDVSTIVNTYMKVKPGRPGELMRRVGEAL